MWEIMKCLILNTLYYPADKYENVKLKSLYEF